MKVYKEETSAGVLQVIIFRAETETQTELLTAIATYMDTNYTKSKANLYDIFTGVTAEKISFDMT